MPSAEYMREYRAQRKRRLEAPVTPPEALDELMRRLAERGERIAFLEAEVASLKRLLAERPSLNTGAGLVYEPDDSFRTFRPAPKPGKRS